jgi:polyisoprenoid-binding protein YceI
MCMNQFARFFTVFSLLALVGGGCVAADVDVDDDMDEMEEGEEHEADEVEEAVEAVMIEAGDYSVDLDGSTIYWVGRKPGAAHNGTINLTEGALSVGEETAGTFVIDMDTIENLDIESEVFRGSLVDHLKSDDFFSVEEFPTATFAITSMEEQDADENYLVTGSLTLKGSTQEVTFPAEVTAADAGYNLVAMFEIDRTLWGVVYGSESIVDSALDVIIEDMMTIELDLLLAS